jgi:galactofuranosylgalactofuranosylrhamnosyl-N-acetylglucosaminyl-diphospho-decaprenol beta-1,5/1,6-galactofuranosyltransferase
VTQASRDVAAQSEPATTHWRAVARVVFPENDIEALPLYLDTTPDLEAAAAIGRVEEARWTRGVPMPGTAVTTTFGTGHYDYITDRRRVALPAGVRVSFATVFNAFPAAYWRRWSEARTVRLDVEVRGHGTVLVYKSNARGIRHMVEMHDLEPGAAQHLSVELSLSPFGDGGWYWFDLAASGHEGIELVEASWSVEVPEAHRGHEPGTVSLGITTMNRETFCVGTLRTLADAAELRTLLDTVYVIDQGGDTLRHTPGYAEAAADLGTQHELVVQDNLGGSGGFSRSMIETLNAGRSRYLLILDDDVNVETEGILRALAFADLARRPLLVGGHMFNMYDRPTMHAYAEAVSPNFTWGPIDRHPPINFALSNLRARPELHRRWDANYNGWWMCLIPTQVIREIGLAIPAFLKWDDAEFCLRAGEAGYPTVTLPGVGVWHVPWTDKDDSVDWQAYLHQHNRLVTALLHGPRDKAPRVVLDSVWVDLRHASAMQYYATTLRLQALEDILEGPEHLHARLRSVIPLTRALKDQFDDARISPDPEAFPPPTGAGRTPLPLRGKRPSNASMIPWFLTVATKQVLAPAKAAETTAPQAYLAKMDANWWRLAMLDSAVVSNADGSGASFYKRDRATWRALMGRSARLHQRLARQWPTLAAQYRAALPEFTSPQTWESTIHGPAGRR